MQEGTLFHPIRRDNEKKLPELIGSFKLGNVLVFLQQIHRPTRTKISCTKTQTLPNLRLPISSGNYLEVYQSVLL